MRSNEKVKTALKLFVLVKLASRDPEGKKIKKSRYIPELVFLSSSGKFIKNSVGFRGADQLAKLLEKMAVSAGK